MELSENTLVFGSVESMSIRCRVAGPARCSHLVRGKRLPPTETMAGPRHDAEACIGKGAARKLGAQEGEDEVFGAGK